MIKSLAIAKNILLTPASLDEVGIEKLFKTMFNRNVDDADLYFQSCSYESWYLEDSEVKSGNFSLDKGVGIRAVSGDKTGFAYCDDILLPSMLRAADAARSIALSGSKTVPAVKVLKAPVNRYDNLNPLEGMSKQEKIALLEAIDKEARSLDPRVIQVNASLTGCYEVVMVANMNGQMMADVRPLVSINVSVIVEDSHGRRESARSGGGGRVAYSYFTEKENALSYAREAVREALTNLQAEPAPAGTMPVVLGPGWPGVLLHEAVGHGLEGDFNRKGLSAFSGRLGQQVAAAGVTVVDDGTLESRRGSLTIDDEGTPSQCTTLIDNGILVNYMQDKLNAKLMGMQSTGNCRRESYAHVPMPRMTNTYMLAGQYDPQEIIRTVKKGLYAVNFGGGQVDITSGQFVFSASEAYLIENGKITKPVKGATLIGNGPDVMKKISMIGNDLALDRGIGVCGKEGQSVPVGVGQPTLKIDALTVGGTK
ncbi:metalloprotease TldD [Legionella pneumophila]|uniref:TldD protein n=1 Tax=Legionella pneumophila subsp. pascullei TaxID=91890 RepID=A0AAX2IVD2_LEGPN|nr:metalloprotease TldD [Legionella pneumophila]AMP90345.1 metalloprotease TldD [Legionella pneumophila subsp. pascullei]AMP91988.1 metalloprotease TldD [Legionella pneumophila subsp. pascullei]AMP94953.1 metalloprotease TldD [Legionella pneumophila subsp. pascullei]SQG89813.1 TldD protein [Legionella pneumophila subsp. pascullei]VEH05459.1 TldD protein [Legionella pneumophila subsp. pascullei]